MRNRINLGNVRYLTSFEHRSDNPDGSQTWALICRRTRWWDKWLGLPFVLWLLLPSGDSDG